MFLTQDGDYLISDEAYLAPSPSDMFKFVYDPQNIEADAFAREHHTGLQPIATIEELASVIPGDAGRDILAMDGANQVVDYLNLKGYPVQTRYHAKQLDPETTPAFYIYGEGSRNGPFVFRPTTALSITEQADAISDVCEGIYFKVGEYTAIRQGSWAVYGADVRWFGAVLNDVADDTLAFNTACKVAPKVIFPVGRAHITNMVTVRNNCELIGINACLSVFSIRPDFNMSALGVVRMGTMENIGMIDKIGFEFEQPDVPYRYLMHQYPWAIYHHHQPRVRIGHIRIVRGWNGIRATGNSGGLQYAWIECGTVNIGLWIDGALDTCNIGIFRHWPFGIFPQMMAGVYSDQYNYAAIIGHCDGLEGEIHTFQGSVDFDANGGNSAGRHIKALHLDGDGARLRVANGVLNIDYLYSTKTDKQPVSHNILLDGDIYSNPKVVINAIDLRTSEPVQPILVNRGSLTINGGRINSVNANVEAALVQNGRLTIRNTELTATAHRDVGYVRSAGNGALIVQNCFSPVNGGTGQIVGLLNDHPEHCVTGNKLCGRSIGYTPAAANKVAYNMP